ncbi:MAG: DUF3326 domain-containing protein [Desulfobacteraceae bacterium]|nr:MAG: DUF3326 domain-containing protein [Desulfobacteraceae bacterium]
MRLTEREMLIPAPYGCSSLLTHVGESIYARIDKREIPVRVAVTQTDSDGYHCEVGILSESNNLRTRTIESIFSLQQRKYENQASFNAVLLVPTGIGAEIGGHSGDAGAVARLLAANCDHLITHPNVVNAADINELPENGLYVEGSVISRMMMGKVGLQKVRSNRIIVIMDQHTDKMFHELSINSVSAARAAMGLDCPLVIKMEDRVRMRSLFSKSGRATGRIDFLEYLFEVIEEHRSEFDAVALTSLIDVPEHFHKDYFDRDTNMFNPWGGVEAMLTHTISTLFDVPSAHSPMMTSSEVMNLDVDIVDPRKAAEAVSTTYLHCILKGLHRSPRVIPDVPIHGDPALLTVANLSCLIIPDGCVGLPTLAALEQGIPVIAVKENKNCMQNRLEDLPFDSGKLFIVENYLEAVGIMSALKAGVAVEAVRRPLDDTNVKSNRYSTKNSDANISKRDVAIG